MSSHVTQYIAELERERKALNQNGGDVLESKRARDQLRSLAEKYFHEVRPKLIDGTIEGHHVEAVDQALGQLVSLCHKRGRVDKYREILKQVKGHLVKLDSILVTSNPNTASPVKTDLDARIVTTLRVLQPSASLSYEQALFDLAQEDRLSWRGPATDLRESLRETLDRLAPDDEVSAMQGYKLEPNTSGPTMKQKVRFILRNRGTSKVVASTAEEATNSIESSMGAFVRSVYTRSSVSTHTPTNKDEVLRVLDLVRVVLAELLEVRRAN